ncbi:MAG: hypothetical protein K2H96_04555 [Muribaculaceae bacterium]|nr:hypothetical protein [Muribaculaceae bacterium]
MKLRNLFYILLMSLFALQSFAVSDKDMEEAKVIAAKLYLRWANNGSGYLDDVSASSMADLESKLKAQEKENLKAFKSVSIPADYASWDKQRFVQFWGTTFFTSPALNADGKRAKDRVKAKVSAMNVSAPSSAPKAEETKPDEAKGEEKKTEEAATPATSNDEGGITIPEPQEVMHQEEAISDSLAVLQADEQSLALADRPEKAKSHTWIYVIILIVLVILVVWLMVYAANMMKKQGKDGPVSDGNEKKYKKEISALEAENDKLRSEISRLKSQIDEAKAETVRLKAAQADERKQWKEEKKATVATSAVAETPVKRPKEESKPQPKVINEIYLGRANPKGLFVRGDRRPNPAHTVFRLDTKDGIVGTFRFVGTPEAFELASSNPLQYLAGGCVSENFEDAGNASKIITEAPGTAILENGCWKVLRKSKIRFE